VAHLTSRAPTEPLGTVSSKPGSWAPSPTEYHGALGFKGTVTLPGPGGGSVTVNYGGDPGPGVFFGGQWSETYNNYSDNGTDFVNGTVTINGLLKGSVSAHLTMTGDHTGTHDAELTFDRLAPGGHAESTLDGHSISGPQPDQLDGGACPSMLPRKPALHVKPTSLGGGVYKVKVTASVGHMGINESAVDTRPVNDATVQLGSRKAHTNKHGVATVKAGGSRKLTVTAGDTLASAHARVGAG
jgi:hypothetical protein